MPGMVKLWDAFSTTFIAGVLTGKLPILPKLEWEQNEWLLERLARETDEVSDSSDMQLEWLLPQIENHLPLTVCALRVSMT